MVGGGTPRDEESSVHSQESGAKAQLRVIEATRDRFVQTSWGGDRGEPSTISCPSSNVWQGLCPRETRGRSCRYVVCQAEPPARNNAEVENGSTCLGNISRLFGTGMCLLEVCLRRAVRSQRVRWKAERRQGRRLRAVPRRRSVHRSRLGLPPSRLRLTSERTPFVSRCQSPQHWN